MSVHGTSASSEPLACRTANCCRSAGCISGGARTTGSYFRALIGGIQNDVTYAFHPDGAKPFELIASMSTSTPLFDSGEYVDGERQDGEELQWGYVRAGFGVGHREELEPGASDNLFASDVLLEPGFLYFGEGEDTAASFLIPDDTFELRMRWTTRYDALERNIIERAHAGVAFGADLIYGVRGNESAWGDASGSGFHAADEVRDHVTATAYGLWATDLPFVAADERHRLVLTFHGGASRTSTALHGAARRGLPDTPGRGGCRSITTPVCPGSGFDGSSPEHYAIASATWRYEISFFAFLETGVTVGWLDRDRMSGSAIVREDDSLSSVHALLTTGFLGQTRLQFGYAYGFDLIREDDEGAHAFTVRASADFSEPGTTRSRSVRSQKRARRYAPAPCCRARSWSSSSPPPPFSPRTPSRRSRRPRPRRPRPSRRRTPRSCRCRAAPIGSCATRRSMPR